MKIVFTSSKSIINAMVDTLKSPGYKMESTVKYLAHNHDAGFSTIGIELTGELTDLIFLGLYTQSTFQRSIDEVKANKSLMAIE